MKIKLSELKQLIQEEAARYKKALGLKMELDEINRQLNEVHAGGAMATDGVHAGQNKVVATTKNVSGSVSKPIVEVGDEMDMDVDAASDLDMGDDSGNGSEPITKEELAKALHDLTVSLNLPDVSDSDMDDEIGIGGEDDMDVDIDMENGEDSEPSGEEIGSAEEAPEAETEEAPEAETEEAPESEESEETEEAPESEEETETLQESEEKQRWKLLAGIYKKRDS